MNKKFTRPESVDPEVWADYEEQRSSSAKLRQGWTDLARRRACAFLSKYPAKVQRQIVDNSIMGGWRGLFEPKQAQAVPMASSHKPFQEDISTSPQDKARAVADLERMQEQIRRRSH